MRSTADDTSIETLVLRSQGRLLAGLESLFTGVSYVPTEAGHTSDPYSDYRRLRDVDPVHRSVPVGGWVLSLAEDVESVLADPQSSVDPRRQPSYEPLKVIRKAAGLWDDEIEQFPSMLRLDPPKHALIRGLVSRAFTPAALTRWKSVVEERADALVDRCVERGSMDLIAEFASPLPIDVIARILGIPDPDAAKFRELSNRSVRIMGLRALSHIRDGYRARRELRDFLGSLVDARRREPGDDVISALAAAELDGNRLSREDILATLELLLVAGNETTTNLIGNGVLALLRHRDQWELIVAEPALIPRAVEEMLRYDSPVQVTTRFATTEFMLRGKRVRVGDRLVLLLGSANRDPRRHHAPDHFDVRRVGPPPLSFSHGPHYCLGAPLARLEARVALETLVRRVPNLALASRRIEWAESVILRGLRELPVHSGTARNAASRSADGGRSAADTEGTPVGPFGPRRIAGP